MQLENIKGNSQPVGLSVIENKPFTNHQDKVEKRRYDLYLF
jgi:hypothetical protein